jgi:hypothetical protein
MNEDTMTKRLLIALFAVALMPPLPATSMTSIAATQERTSPAPTPPPPPPAPPAAPARPPAPPDAPPALPQAPPPPRPGTQVTANVQLDVVITDTIGGRPEAKRVTLVIRSGSSGAIRTQGMVEVAGDHSPVELGLDGNARVLGPELVEVNVTFNYTPPPANVGAATDSSMRVMGAPRVIESLSATLRSGRPLLVSRSADPATNRTVTVELTATVREP